MIKGISYWSIGAQVPMEEAMKQARDAGFGAIELAFAIEGELSPSSPRVTCDRLRNAAEKIGIEVQSVASGMSWAVSPTHNDPEIRKRSIALHTDALQRAAWLGVDAMLFVPGAVKIPWNTDYKPVPYENAMVWAKEAVQKLAETAEKLNIDLCVENVWNGLFYSPIEFASFIDSIGSPRVGVYFDVGNVLGYHQHPPHWIRLLGKRIRRVHIKDFKNSVGTLAGFCDLLEGDVPFAESMKALREIGYDKTLIAEMMPPAPGLLERTSKAMDKILAM
jgi:hexulose-6-phosphate isomerase